MRTLLTLCIALTIIASGCTDQMVTKEKQTKEVSLEQYREEKELLFKQGKQAQLEQELKTFEEYLNGTLNYEIASTQEEMARTYQQINILRTILKLPKRPLDKGIDPLFLK